MKIKLNKTIDTNKIVLHCNEHNIDNMSFLEAATNHPECAVMTNDYKFIDLFYKCMNKKTGPSFSDFTEGNHNSDWERIQHEQVVLFDKVSDKMESI